MSATSHSDLCLSNQVIELWKDFNLVFPDYGLFRFTSLAEINNQYALLDNQVIFDSKTVSRIGFIGITMFSVILWIRSIWPF
jgi:hypothetical protein